MPRILGMTQSAYDPASRVRLIQFLPALRSSGWDVVHRPNVPDRQWVSTLPTRGLRALHYRLGRMLMKANRWRDVRSAGAFDVVFVNRDLAGGGIFFEERLLRTTPRVVFDFDDAIFIGKNEPAVRWMCEHAAWITPGNDYLAQYASRFNRRVTVIPTVVDTDRYRVKDYTVTGDPGRVRVGWSGSDRSIESTLFRHLGMLAELQKKLDFEFVIVANTRPVLPVKDFRWTFVPWTVEGEADLALQMDVGLMPLEDNEFQRGKCGLKLLQYMAAGLPIVGSPVGVNANIIEEGKNGYWATAPAEWGAALEALVRSPQRRADMGRMGRKMCEEQWSIRRWLPVLEDVFLRVIRNEHAG